MNTVHFQIRWIGLVALLSLLTGCSAFNLGQDMNPYEMQQSALRAYDSGNDAEAESLYLGLIRIAPNDPENLLRLGNLYARANRPDRAAETYTQALLLAPGDSRLWYNLGIIRQRQGLAAMMQAHLLTAKEDPLHIKSEALTTCLAPVVKEAVIPSPVGN
jgi:tetratricopeptide (TPR) repeat protein